MCLFLMSLSILPTVVNMSFVAFIGDPITVPEDIRVVIDCSPVIDDAVMEGEVANITWFKNDRPIVNGSEVNVVLSSDNRTIEITDTLRGTPAMVGTEGNYSCEVCVVDRTCLSDFTPTDVCGKCH